jgi:hypothetical protein
LNYTENEWNRVNTMIRAAEKALREDHKTRHQQTSIQWNWPVRIEI